MGLAGGQVGRGLNPGPSGKEDVWTQAQLQAAVGRGRRWASSKRRRCWGRRGPSRRARQDCDAIAEGATVRRLPVYVSGKLGVKRRGDGPGEGWACKASSDAGTGDHAVVQQETLWRSLPRHAARLGPAAAAQRRCPELRIHANYRRREATQERAIVLGVRVRTTEADGLYAKSSRAGVFLTRLYDGGKPRARWETRRGRE